MNNEINNSLIKIINIFNVLFKIIKIKIKTINIINKTRVIILLITVNIRNTFLKSGIIRFTLINIWNIT